jgi:dTMP kinase
LTFEGTDGSGKTTQLRRQAARLTAAGRATLVTREPGGTSAGAAIRGLLLEHRTPALAPEAELLLYAADRAQHVRELIEPSLASGTFVLCDRYIDATVAYQGYGRGLRLDVIAALNRIATGGLEPDLTILFDLDVEASMARLAVRSGSAGGEAPTRFDLEAVEFHQRVRDGYLALATASPERFRIIDASASIDDVGAEVDRVVDAFLSGAVECHSLPL